MSRPRIPLSDDDFYLLRLIIAGWNSLRVGKKRIFLGQASLGAETLAVLMPLLPKFRILLDDAGIQINSESAANPKAKAVVAEEFRSQALADLLADPTGVLGHLAVHATVLDEAGDDDDTATALWTDPTRLFDAVRREVGKLGDDASAAAIRKAIIRALNGLL